MNFMLQREKFEFFKFDFKIFGLSKWVSGIVNY